MKEVNSVGSTGGGEMEMEKFFAFKRQHLPHKESISNFFSNTPIPCVNGESAAAEKRLITSCWIKEKITKR
jgi:hypothetical protein